MNEPELSQNPKNIVRLYERQRMGPNASWGKQT